MAIDTDRLLTEALKKHGIRLDPDDPAVVLVTLNRLVLEDVAESMSADIGKATREFEVAARNLQGKVGSAVAAAIKTSTRSATAPLWNQWVYLAIGLASGGGLFLAGIAIGKWVLR
jgi:hypothetical protein